MSLQCWKSMKSVPSFSIVESCRLTHDLKMMHWMPHIECHTLNATCTLCNLHSKIQNASNAVRTWSIHCTPYMIRICVYIFRLVIEEGSWGWYSQSAVQADRPCWRGGSAVKPESKQTTRSHASNISLLSRSVELSLTVQFEIFASTSDISWLVGLVV